MTAVFLAASLFDSGFFWAALTVIASLVIIFGGALPAIRTQRARGVIDLQATEIKAYKEALEAQAQRYDNRLSGMEARHQREIGELKGRVDAMTPDFASTLAGLLIPMLRDEGSSR